MLPARALSSLMLRVPRFHGCKSGALRRLYASSPPQPNSLSGIASSTLLDVKNTAYLDTTATSPQDVEADEPKVWAGDLEAWPFEKRYFAGCVTFCYVSTPCRHGQLHSDEETKALYSWQVLLACALHQASCAPIPDGAPVQVRGAEQAAERCGPAERGSGQQPGTRPAASGGPQRTCLLPADLVPGGLPELLGPVPLGRGYRLRPEGALLETTKPFVRAT